MTTESSEPQRFAETARPEPWSDPSPEGFHFEPMPAGDDWRIDDTKRCRWLEKRKSCGQPSVLALRRGKAGWWGYCAEHTYGRWVEDGQVWQWRLAPNAEVQA